MIVKMKRAFIICLKEDKKNLLRSLQRSEEIMLIDSLGYEKNTDRNEKDKHYKTTGKLIKKIKDFEEKKGILPYRQEVSYDKFMETDRESIDIRNKCKESLESIATINKKINEHKSTLLKLLPWISLHEKAENLKDTSYTKLITGFVNNKQLNEFNSKLVENGAEVLCLGNGDSGKAVIIACYIDDAGIVYNTIKDFEFSEISLPVKSGLVLEEYNKTENYLDELEKDLKKEEENLKELSKKSDKLRLLFDQQKAKNERETAPVTNTERTVIIEGWVRADQLDNVAETAKKSTEVCEVIYCHPEKGEVVPTATKNSKFVQQFEVITEMFSPPSYNNLDPNPVMAPWYWIIFGIMVGDVGYGMLMLVFCLVFNRLYKPRGTVRKIANILLLSSATTMIWGVLFGSYFGVTWNPILFSPLEKPIEMLVFSLGIGVLHIFSGMLINAVESIRNGNILDAIFDQFSWMFIIIGIALMFFGSTLLLGVILAVAGSLVVLITAGRSKKNIAGKIAGGLAGLYGITAYVSDILSYSRILALSLATGVVAMVMNMLAQMMSVSVIGFVLSFLVYIVGHIFNLVLGLLSAYVHDSRLQYIEFFNKFYEGGGKMFKPFSINTNYIDIKKKNNIRGN
jgi:V/A-type H+-transporting ATPase subunit I